MGFENIVRPAVVPNIRPQPPRVLPPASDPTSGFAVIRGNSASSASGSRSYSLSYSQSKQREVERLSDKRRIYQKEDIEPGDGKGDVNKDNFIDVYATKRITTKGGAQPKGTLSVGGSSNVQPKSHTWYELHPFDDTDNIETLERNVTQKANKDVPPPLPGGTFELIDEEDAKNTVEAAQKHIQDTIIPTFAVKGTFKLKSMTGEFSTDYELQVTDLKIPTGYDLEASGGETAT